MEILFAFQFQKYTWRFFGRAEKDLHKPGWRNPTTTPPLNVNEIKFNSRKIFWYVVKLAKSKEARKKMIGADNLKKDKANKV